MMTTAQFDQTTADISTEMPVSACHPPRKAPMVSMTVTRSMAVLLTRLQQLSKSKATVIVDLENMTLQVCGKVENFR